MPSIRAITIGGIIKAIKIPATKPKMHNPHSFFKKFLKNNTHTPF